MKEHNVGGRVAIAVGAPVQWNNRDAKCSESRLKGGCSQKWPPYKRRLSLMSGTHIEPGHRHVLVRLD